MLDLLKFTTNGQLKLKLEPSFQLAGQYLQIFSSGYDLKLLMNENHKIIMTQSPPALPKKGVSYQ